MAGSLVTFTPGLTAAGNASKEEKRESVLADSADETKVKMMERVVKVPVDGNGKPLTDEAKRASAESDAGSRKNVPTKAGASIGNNEPVKSIVGASDVRRDITEPIAQKKEKPPVTLDEHGNPVGKEHDLVADGKLTGLKAMIVNFDKDPDITNSPLAGALTAKGLEVSKIQFPLPALLEWEKRLDSVNQVWMFSSQMRGHLPKGHLAALVTRWKAGRLALALLADNDNFTQETNTLLAEITPGNAMRGEYSGEKDLGARTEKGVGFLSGHPVFHGIESLYEGVTISKLVGKQSLTPICWASDGGVLLSTYQAGKSSRLICDGGYTRYYGQYWNKAATERLAGNIAAWLAGKEGGVQSLALRNRE